MRQKQENFISAGEFYDRTGISNAQVRVLEAAKVLNPRKGASGWRQFPASDVHAALAWKAEQAERKAARLAAREAARKARKA